MNLIDVGAVGGLPSPWAEHANKIGHLLKFEPREIARELAYVKSLNVALSVEDGPRDLHIYKGQRGSGSSLYRQNYGYVRNNYEWLRKRGPRDLAETWFHRSELRRVETVDCRSLDSVLRELESPVTYHFLKIDAQGAEYDILEGAAGFLKTTCMGLHLELFTVPLYEGIRLLPEVQDYLHTLGFDLAKKFPAHGSFNSQHDCLFLKEHVRSNVMDVVQQVYDL